MPTIYFPKFIEKIFQTAHFMTCLGFILKALKEDEVFRGECQGAQSRNYSYSYGAKENHHGTSSKRTRRISQHGTFSRLLWTNIIQLIQSREMAAVLF